MQGAEAQIILISIHLCTNLMRQNHGNILSKVILLQVQGKEGKEFKTEL